jgi:hypothetical protein
MATPPFFMLCFYVPETHVEVVKEAVFDAGAGRIGNYDHCCWQTLGQGQFRSLPGSQPYLGQEGQIEHVPELKVEMVVSPERLESVLQALMLSHPYETPAFHCWPAMPQSGR